VTKPFIFWSFTQKGWSEAVIPGRCIQHGNLGLMAGKRQSLKQSDCSCGMWHCVTASHPRTEFSATLMWEPEIPHTRFLCYQLSQAGVFSNNKSSLSLFPWGARNSCLEKRHWAVQSLYQHKAEAILELRGSAPLNVSWPHPELVSPSLSTCVFN